MIQMKAGTFGLPVNGIIKGMTKESGPFEASAEQEARLVKLGLAVYVGEPASVTEVSSEAEKVEGEKSLEDMTANELRELGKEYGLTFKVGMKKADMIEAITAAQAEGSEDEDAEDEGIDGSEDAPIFDASEAVQ